MDAVVRAARPGDAGFLAWAVLTAGRAHLARGWYDVALGLPEPEVLRLLERLVTTVTPSFWRHENVLVAEVDGQPVAALSAFGSTSGWGDAQGALAEAAAPLGWSADDLANVWIRGAYVFSCTFAPQEDVWVIENVAVAPSVRGMGVAGRLLEAAFDRGRGRGFRQAQITFQIGNAPAERAYAKAGFRLSEEKRHPDFEAVSGSPGLRRFVRAL